jgi:divinyl protochlorophyllide a 8-vinyl-reductase
VSASTVVGRVSGRIGPNAIIRVAESLPARIGSAATEALFATAGLAHYLREPPESMVDEAEVGRLHEVLRRQLGVPAACEVTREAGARTGAYLLAHRIPRPVQWLLRHLPAPLAARVLVAAIARHAWTFAGSGRFGARWQRGGVVLAIENCPLCRRLAASDPACDFYCATFERLFDELVRTGSTVAEVACQACGGEACVFEVRW